MSKTDRKSWILRFDRDILVSHQYSNSLVYGIEADCYMVAFRDRIPMTLKLRWAAVQAKRYIQNWLKKKLQMRMPFQMSRSKLSRATGNMWKMTSRVMDWSSSEGKQLLIPLCCTRNIHYVLTYSIMKASIRVWQKFVPVFSSSGWCEHRILLNCSLRSTCMQLITYKVVLKCYRIPENLKPFPCWEFKVTSYSHQMGWLC